MVGYDKARIKIGNSVSTQSDYTGKLNAVAKIVPSPPSWKAQKLVGSPNTGVFNLPPPTPLQQSPYLKGSPSLLSVAATSGGFAQVAKQFRIGGAYKDLTTMSVSRKKGQNVFSLLNQNSPYKSHTHESKTSLHSVGVFGSLESLAPLSNSSRELPKLHSTSTVFTVKPAARPDLKISGLISPQIRQVSPQKFADLPSDRNQREESSPARNQYRIQWFSNNFIPLSSVLTFGKVIGEGTYAKVYEGWETGVPNRPLVAVKLFQKRLLMQSGSRKSLQGEVDHLSKLQHPNIVQLKKVVEDQKFVCLVCQYCGQNTLKEELSEKGWTENTLSLFHDLASALNYLHLNQVYHRDLKLTNVMIHEDSAILIDFGMATTSTSKEYLYCGTGCYLSPEMVSRQGYYGGPNDVWAFGVMLFKAFSGYFPFGGRKTILTKDSKNLKETEQSIARCRYPRQAVQGCPQLMDLLDRIFTLDTGRRITMSQTLNHPVWTLLRPRQQRNPSPLKTVREIDSRSEAVRLRSPARKPIYLDQTSATEE